MFNLFNKRKEEPPQDVKTVRELLLTAIKQELQKLEGGEGKQIKGLALLIACLPAEQYMYESAVYFEDEARFKNEIQRIIDDFAIDLPENWTMQINFVDELPADAIKLSRINAALYIKTPEHVVVTKSKTAYIRTLNGESEKKEYKITASDGKINIGREHKVQVSDGFFRINHIAFPDGSTNEANKFISRQHAHIEWDSNTGTFLLFADEGGIPPRNKVRMRSVGDHTPVKLNVAELGHVLQEGDQIILGELAVLEFSYIEVNNN
ncbi:FHA domain-containing protein [Pedobacter nyackensis]|uniref:FHA domain-containing protein n=1 Tax=Pedobacter nyackensis TaxID=475255 RepID=A0A1W2EN38_9SPHI|nr:FHA domain-containing protein [Pedobacter nyackensis]SMD10568.1 FHA domain-containing protein [Pedobacter nyackensis]